MSLAAYFPNPKPEQEWRVQKIKKINSLAPTINLKTRRKKKDNRNWKWENFTTMLTMISQPVQTVYWCINGLYKFQLCKVCTQLLKQQRSFNHLAHKTRFKHKLTSWIADRAITFGKIFHGHFLSLILLTGLTISASADDGPQRQGSWHPTWGDVANQLFCFSHAHKMLQDGVPPSWCPMRRNQRFQHQTIQFLDLLLRHSIHMTVIWLSETSLTGTIIPTCNPHFMLSLQRQQKVLPRECQDCQYAKLEIQLVAKV